MADVATQNAPQTPTKKTPKKTPKKATQKVQEVQDEAEDSQEQLDDSQMTNGAAEHAEDAADDAQEQGEDVEDEAEQTAEGAGEDAGDEGDEPQSIAEGDSLYYDPASSIIADYSSPLGAQSQAEEAGEQAEEETDEAKGKVEETGEEAQEQGEEAAEQAQAAGEEAQDKAEGATEEAPEAAQDQTEAAHDQADEAAEGAQDKAAEAGEAAEGAHEQAEGTAEDAKDQVEGAADEAQGEDGGDVVPIGKVDDDGKSVVTDAGQLVGSVAGDTEVPAGSVVDQEGDIMDSEGNVIGSAEPNAEGAHEDAENAAEGAEDQAEGAVDGAQETAEGAKDEAEGAAEELKPDFEGALAADEDGAVKDEAGNVIANLAPEEQEKLGDQEIADIDNEGNLKNEDGEVVAQAELAEGVKKVKPEFEGALSVTKQGVIKDESGKTIANLDKEQLKQLGKQKIHDIDADGNCLAEDGTVLATCEIAPQEELDYSILNGCKVNKLGNVVSSEGTVVGKLVEGDAKKLAGKECDEEGRIWGDKGKQIGQAEPLPEAERAANETKPFEDFPDAVVEHSGDVTFEGRVVGKLVEGDKKQCEGKKVDPDGDVADKNGNTIGHAERLEDEPEQAPEEIDYSILVGHVVNKAGNVVKEDDGTPLGKVVEGELKYLIGKKVFKEGKIYNDGGDVIGRAEPIPENERITPKESPFEDFQPAVVQKNGDVMFQKDQKVGEVVEGDPKKLAGKEVDPEGDIVDKSGSVIGRAERWEEPEEEEAAPIDMSILAGKRVNKQGYVADPKSGDLYGKVVEGDVKKLQGKMCDKEGNIWDEGGNKVGRAELIPESERSGSKQGPFSDFQPCTVQKDGTVVDKAQNVVGRVKEGDAKQLFGKQVDEDGDINDSNGNKIGAAERWEPEEKEADKHPAAGLKVNREGNVVDQNGDVIAKLTEGEIPQCRGKEIDDDGDVVDQKGKSVGHVTLLEDIKPDEEPQGPSEEELAAQKAQQEKDDQEAASKKKDRDLAKRLGYEVDQTLERIKPVLDEMMEYIDEANAKPKEEVDEQKLVDNVKPLIHKGSDILNECNKNIRGMDPDGRIQSKAKQNAGSEEATPEENHLAEGLKTLTGSVTDSIEKAKKKVNGLPHAKKELNPLWGLLSEPLFQILAAVGLLLSGVLGLVGKLLGGLGLGGIVDGLLGGLGLNKLTEGLGLGKLAGGGK